ncbi:MAG: diacylglycerol kinase [Deferrisomatales bacterium]|nr:diacylglycerol kinase [Deferrisomatales bacterium]
MKPETWLQTLNCAVEGVVHGVRTQRHLRWQSLVCLAVLLVAPRLGVTPAEFALLCLAAALVLVAELTNTAVEASVDLACPDVNPLARAAKDVAAGAVLVASFAAVAVGWVVLLPAMQGPAGALLREANARKPVVLAASLLAVLVVVILIKGAVGRGQALRGGFPSGHAAVSFAVAALLTLHTQDLIVAVLTAILALMVSHSRLLHRIHTRAEVAVGAVLGTLLGAALFWILH